MTIARAIRGLGMLVVVVCVLGGTWTLAQRQAVKSAVRERSSVTTSTGDAEIPASAHPTAVSWERLAAVPSATPPAPVGSAQRGSGEVPADLERIEEFQRQVNLRAEQTASLVRTPRDLEPVLAEIERSIERSMQVNAFHAKSSVAAVRAAYRDRPEDELEARLLELDRRLLELSAKFDPLVREGLAAGAARQNRFN